MSSENVNDYVKAGHGIARMLKEYGVEYVFGIPDGHTLALYDGLLQTEGIKHVLFNDERSAAFAADAYARVTGTLGVCDSGSAGSMNFPVALAEAKGVASPVLAIVGTVKSKDVLKNIPHDINVADTLKPITKWTEKVMDVQHLPRFLSYAVKQATTGKPGPVALVISEDVLSSQDLKLKDFIPREGGSCSINNCRTAPARSEIEQAVRIIRLAKQPCIFAGGGAVISAAYQEIAELARILKCPVFSTITGKGIMIPNKDSEKNLYFGTVGLFGERPNHRFLKEKTDLVLSVGNRLTEDDTANFKYPSQDTAMIQIDIDPGEIGLMYKSIGIVGDPKAALFEIINNIRKKRVVKTNLEPGFKSSQVKDEYQQTIMLQREQNLKILRQQHKEYREADTRLWINKEPIKPQRVLKSISDNFTENDYLITDASASSRWIGPYFPVKSQGRKIITPRGVGPTGFGVGALIGTCLAVESINFEKKSIKKVLFTGDGGLMNGGITEFETIKKLNLDCSIIVINNAALGFVKFGQLLLYKKRFYDTDRPDTDFSCIAKAFGANGVRVEKLNELDNVIEQAMNSKGFNLVDVKVDPMEFLPPSSF